MTQQVLGMLSAGTAKLEEAAQSFRNALFVRARNVNAEQWAESQMFLAPAISAISTKTGNNALADEAIAAYRTARELFTRDAFRSDWRRVSSGLATALQGKGILRQDGKLMYEAEAILKEVLADTDRTNEPLTWASAMKDIATLQFVLGTTHMNRRKSRSRSAATIWRSRSTGSPAVSWTR